MRNKHTKEVLLKVKKQKTKQNIARWCGLPYIPLCCSASGKQLNLFLITIKNYYVGICRNLTLSRIWTNEKVSEMLQYPNPSLIFQIHRNKPITTENNKNPRIIIYQIIYVKLQNTEWRTWLIYLCASKYLA